MRTIWTKRGYNLAEVVSALQKALRRGDVKMAGYWACEMNASGFRAYMWRRLLIISAEDCWGILTQEVRSLYESDLHINKTRKGRETRVFFAKAVCLIGQAKKSRDADHLTNLIYDAKSLTEEEIERDLKEAEKDRHEIPPEALDMHTAAGKRKGMTKEEFIIREHEALQPLIPGLFDREVEKLKRAQKSAPD